MIKMKIETNSRILDLQNKSQARGCFDWGQQVVGAVGSWVFCKRERKS